MKSQSSLSSRSDAKLVAPGVMGISGCGVYIAASISGGNWLSKGGAKPLVGLPNGLDFASESNAAKSANDMFGGMVISAQSAPTDVIKSVRVCSRDTFFFFLSLPQGRRDSQRRNYTFVANICYERGEMITTVNVPANATPT